jgi:hypothetical protein
MFAKIIEFNIKKLKEKGNRENLLEKIIINVQST